MGSELLRRLRKRSRKGVLVVGARKEGFKIPLHVDKGGDDDEPSLH